MRGLNLSALLVSMLLITRSHAQCADDFITAPDPEPGNAFGRRIVMNEEYLVVSAFNANTVYIYSRGRDSWELTHTVTEPTVSEDALYGFAIDIDDDLLVVGAPEDVQGPDAPDGSVFVYRVEREQVVREATLRGDRSLSTFGGFGWSVGISDENVVVGWRGFELLEGRAQFFQRDGQSWALSQDVSNPVKRPFSGFGASVALDGRRAIVGQPSPGIVYAFRKENGTWVVDAAFEHDSPIGNEISLVGDTVAFGSVESVLIAVYRKDRWQEPVVVVSRTGVGPSPDFGESVAISADEQTILVGAISDQAFGFDSGSAHVLRHINGRWIETARLVAPNAGAGDEFGDAVAIHGDQLVIGSRDTAYPFAGGTNVDCNSNGVLDGCDILSGASCDSNHNSVPNECEALLSDLNGNGSVGFGDLVTLLANWGLCDAPCVADFDCDGLVNFCDLLTLLGQWT